MTEKRATVPQDYLLNIFIKRGRSAFRVLRSAEAPMVKHRPQRRRRASVEDSG